MDLLNSAEKITLANVSDIKASYFRGSTRDIILAALQKDIEVFHIFPKKEIFVLKKGDQIIWINKTLSSVANPVSLGIAKNKHLTKDLLEKLGIPTTLGMAIKNEDELEKIAAELSFPLVIKPADGGGGFGVYVNLHNHESLKKAYGKVSAISKQVLVEKFVAGDYYRLTIIGNGAYATTKNLPAVIIGNGKDTVEQLIEKENQKNPERQVSERLNKIKISSTVSAFLLGHGFTLDSVIPENIAVPISFGGYGGGEYIDVTKETHPSFIKAARLISETLELPIIGIDFIAKDISAEFAAQNGVVLEINASFPLLQFHREPTQGEPRNLAPDLIDYLFFKSKEL